jgi:isopentenyl diphosphate isomerase/L-lactate dehydrogenase-like FMN-dependent dehydrogenase
VFDYIDGGAEEERTSRANLAAFDAFQFQPRMAATNGADPGDLAITALGTPVSLPVLLSPVGSTRIFHPGGEIAGSRAAAAAGTILTVSTMSGHTIGEVAAGAPGPLWFQLYFLGGRDGAERLVGEARSQGYKALVVTVDTAATGPREREYRTGLRPPIKVDFSTIRKVCRQVAVRPRWLAASARDGFQFGFANVSYLSDSGRPMTQTDALRAWYGAPAKWEDFSWLREHFGGPVIAKGVLSGDDARRAIDAGASAIIVSNHGGRQLDRAPATLPALIEVMAAVGNQVEVYVDGGFRRGSDVVAALALGARAVMIGRPWAYGLAADGERGVGHVIEIFRGGIIRTLRLLGCPTLAALGPEFLKIPPSWR